MKPDLRALVQAAQAAGWRVERAAHIKLRGAGGLIVLPSTPSDWRSVQNARAMLRSQRQNRSALHKSRATL
jgi:hypothetical protein